jgi:hypothetical protein
MEAEIGAEFGHEEFCRKHLGLGFYESRTKPRMIKRDRHTT